MKINYKIYFLLVALIPITACGLANDPVSQSNRSCTVIEKDEVKSHISNQIEAIASLDWEKAYTFAAQSFRDGVTLDQFARIIQRQYQMIIINDSYSFSNCAIKDGIFNQEVNFETMAGQYLLNYRLSKVENKFGVVGAEV
ncbi:MAG: DUF4864 domain-containing protein, partial [Actinobacteria bacterium]|nr:DUF4864 domain-containing protein [Actinomycetota bacterium]